MTRLDDIRQAMTGCRPGASVDSIQPLKGGMSAELWLAEGTLSDGERLQVVARFPGAGLQSVVDKAAEYEFRVLESVRSLGIPAPKPLGLGSSSSGQFLLLEYLPGRATARAESPSLYVAEFARSLAAIHRASSPPETLAFLLSTRRQFVPADRDMNHDLREPEVTAALVSSGPQQDAFGLRHGDYWPGNTLWENGAITGIIDWENALFGPAIADLGISRLDICWIFGRDAMNEFTARYLEEHAIDASSLPYWDLRAALRPMSNLPEWSGPYSSLDRPDITPDHLQSVLLEFVEDALVRWRGH